MLWESVAYVWNKTSNIILQSGNIFNPTNTSCIHSNKNTTATKSKKGYLYAFHLHGNTYKVGKTISLSQRIRPYKTVVPNGHVFHTVECINIDSTEKILHYLLKLTGRHSTKEIFTVPGNILKEYMNLVAAMEKSLLNDDSVGSLVKISKFLKSHNK